MLNEQQMVNRKFDFLMFVGLWSFKKWFCLWQVS